MRDTLTRSKTEHTDRINKLFRQITTDLERKRKDLVQEVDQVFDKLFNKTGPELDFPKKTRDSLDLWKAE